MQVAGIIARGFEALPYLLVSVFLTTKGTKGILDWGAFERLDPSLRSGQVLTSVFSVCFSI
jgi:hypothetical protein